ncbi:type IV secretion system protein [Ereboglobus luteus]|uniref:Uncharacterized protein n=1 Tax=Ereboglobus luteus TaxID=1796921 RepID=A0A2U8E0G5_9BACT|nr:type IV secretion system protein [Ereboglobus luteus]AWI08301.1 hypothetical protein CKA38_02670 [Ereboglobus luteus]
MKKLFTLFFLATSTALSVLVFAGMPVIDAANIANSQISHIATIAKWVENIAQLKAQITQLKEQVNIQGSCETGLAIPLMPSNSFRWGF